MLAVVDLALDDAVDDGTGLVAAHPDMQEDGGIVPVDELRGDDAGVGAEGLLDELVDGGRIEGHVVVAQQEEGGTLDHGQRLVGRCGVRGSVREVADERVRQDATDPLGHAVAVVARGEHQDRELLVVLGGQGGERLFEPGPGLGRDHDGDHGRHLGVHQGGEAIALCIGPLRHEGGPSGTKLPRLTACYCLTNVILLYVNAAAGQRPLRQPIFRVNRPDRRLPCPK